MKSLTTKIWQVKVWWIFLNLLLLIRYCCRLAATLWDFLLTLCWQLRRLVRAIWSSPQRRQAWLWDAALHQQSKADDLKKPLMLILDVPTHWSLTHQMLRKLAYLHYQSTFHARSQVVLSIIVKPLMSFWPETVIFVTTNFLSMNGMALSWSLDGWSLFDQQLHKCPQRSAP